MLMIATSDSDFGQHFRPFLTNKRPLRPTQTADNVCSAAKHNTNINCGASAAWKCASQLPTYDEQPSSRPGRNRDFVSRHLPVSLIQDLEASWLLFLAATVARLLPLGHGQKL